MLIFLDVETIGTSRADVRNRLASEVVPKHGNGRVITDEAKAAAWWAEHGTTAIDEAVARTALDGGLGELVCICAAAGDGDVEYWVREPNEALTERDLLVLFFDWLAELGYETGGPQGWLPARITYVGHNIGFDLKFIWRRAVVLKLRPPVPIPYDVPPWRDSYIDTMQMWAGADSRDKVKLVRLCEALGIEVDDDIDGSQVWERWRAGDIDTIVRHCRADVERVRECYRRMTWAI